MSLTEAAAPIISSRVYTVLQIQLIHQQLVRSSTELAAVTFLKARKYHWF